jgi:hypothetical protein
MEKKTFISDNPIKTSERLDFNGNIINPITKQVIVPNEPDFVPPPNPQSSPEAIIEPTKAEIPKDDAISIQKEIEQTEANLARLKEAKRSKIEEMEKLLIELKK